MRFQGGRAAALTAVVLLAAGACTAGAPKDDDGVSLDSNAVRLTRPELRVGPTGVWALSASFAWEFCGARGCFAFGKVRVAAGRAGDNPKVEWGDDQRQVFTAIPRGVGIYDCAGQAK